MYLTADGYVLAFREDCIFCVDLDLLTGTPTWVYLAIALCAELLLTVCILFVFCIQYQYHSDEFWDFLETLSVIVIFLYETCTLPKALLRCYINRLICPNFV